MYSLKSFAYVGVAVVAFTAVAAIVVAPAPSTATSAVSDLNDISSSFNHARGYRLSPSCGRSAAVVVIGHNVAVRAL
jgi:hypothetical protein